MRNKCIICNENISSQYLFCKDCYYENCNIEESLDDLEKENIISLNNILLKMYQNKFNCSDNSTLKQLLYCCAKKLEEFYNLPLIEECKNFIKEYSIYLDDYIQNIDSDEMIINLKNEELSDYIKILNNIRNNPSEDYRQKYESKYRAKDGHYVRSRAELIIDNWLYDNNIIHEYEKRVTDSETKNHIYSDFYLKEHNIYIEFYGLNNEKYNNKTEYKRELYKNNNLNVIELFENDLEHIEDVLEDKILNK